MYEAAAPAAEVNAQTVLWSQFVLARALTRVMARARLRGGEAEAEISFCYADTHGGCGRLPQPAPFLEALWQRRAGFSSQEYFAALEAPDQADHPGSWVLAGRILRAVGGDGAAIELDVNDIDPGQVEQARSNREGGWVRLWTHDWFLFLRSRLAMAAPLDFVFIDPPGDDPRGPAYAIDAAILLETRKVPYMVTYSLAASQESIDQIGRSGLELVLPDGGCGAVLGGGAEVALLDLLPDLRHLAGLLGGRFAVRLPRNDDYSI